MGMREVDWNSCLRSHLPPHILPKPEKKFGKIDLIGAKLRRPKFCSIKKRGLPPTPRAPDSVQWITCPLRGPGSPPDPTVPGGG